MQYEVKLDILDIMHIRYLDLLSDPPLARGARALLFDFNARGPAAADWPVC